MFSMNRLSFFYFFIEKTLTKVILRPIFKIKEAEMAHAEEKTTWDFNSSELPYYDQIYKTALRMTRSVAETEDLLQETYLKAFRYYSGFEEGTNLKAWLYRIMKNSFINGYRKRKAQPQHVELDELRDSDDLQAGADATAAEDGPEASSLAEEMDGDVARAINALPHDYKMALLLIDLQGQTYQEASEILAVPVGTVMSRLYRGRAKIEKALMSYGKRYNYLSRPPRKIRDATIEVEKIFESAKV
jgi:RNA polymerase sigma-70 factor (ECF subfamily)